jgi:DNA-binding NarL/FixJ family response regulator
MRQSAVFVLDSHDIFRRGMVSCLEAADGIASVEQAGSVGEAWDNPALGEADVALVDVEAEGSVDFVRELHGFAGVRALAIGDAHDTDRVGAAAAAGAYGALERGRLTPRALILAVLTAAEGGAMLYGASPASLAPVAAGPASAPAGIPAGPALTPRERDVLALIADGLPTRQVATDLNYSERTIKKVLGDIVVKLGARSRSQAIACAVRQGLI